MIFFLLLSVSSVRALLPVSILSDCPGIPPQSDLKIDQVTGSWRLAYLFVDDTENFEEDNACAVAEFTQVNETKLEMILYVDGKKDEFTIDRYTKEFDVTMLSPGEWLMQTSFMHMEFIHVTVISCTRSHLILTFCVDPFEPEDPPDDYDVFVNTIDRDSMDDILKAQRYNKIFKEMDDMNMRLSRQKRVRRPSRLLRGRRYAEEEPSSYEKMLKYLRGLKSGRKPQKHLWTAILVKDNNISALKFVENASLLMKFGYKLTNGQLISFGACGLTKK